ncbi:hypothetical protein M231_00856 [Tremella mesenterica]|uniref:CCHC-type domain-containing protein n=1 Tax=Tremella mesenterica TaxID=5217 RepID=A0A4V1M4X2_TREME|nr:hypothetical protein M231_00856 [Tremella mesenterica]
MGLLMELQELSTAKQMWDWLENDMVISTPQHRSAIERKLRTHFLPSNSSFSDDTRVELFLDSPTRATDFDIALCIFQQQFGYLHTWDNVRKMYQGEIARREARGEGEVVEEVNAVMQKASLELGAKGKGKPRFKGKKGGGGGGKDSWGKGEKDGPKCWNCGESGHMKMDCPRKEDNNEGQMKGKGKGEKHAGEARLEEFEIGAIGKDNLSTSTSIPKFLGWKVDLHDMVLSRNGLIIKGKRRGSFLFVQMGIVHHNPSQPEGFEIPQVNEIEARTSLLEEEHKQLGHIGREKLLKLAGYGLLHYPREQLEQDTFRLDECDACQADRATRLPKGKESPRGKVDGETVHVDLASPFDPSIGGNHHYLAMIDDYSLLLRSDGGLEFASGSAGAWYHKTGLIHQVTPRYTPELNGVVERFNRTLKEMTGAMLADPNLKNALMFGELVFVQIPGEIRGKSRLDIDKGELGRVVGMDPAKSGWYIRMEKDGKMLFSRDVKSASGHPSTPEKTITPLTPPTVPVPNLPARPITTLPATLPSSRMIPPVRPAQVVVEPLEEEETESVSVRENGGVTEQRNDDGVDGQREARMDVEVTQETPIPSTNPLPAPIPPDPAAPAPPPPPPVLPTRRSARIAGEVRYQANFVEKWYSNTTRASAMASEMGMEEANSSPSDGPQTAREALTSRDKDKWKKVS